MSAADALAFFLNLFGWLATGARGYRWSRERLCAADLGAARTDDACAALRTA